MTRRITRCAVLALTMCPAIGYGQAELPRELEVRLALSALPEHLRVEATVYVFEPNRGYLLRRTGTNGFHALVGRTDPAIFRGSWEYTEHFDDVLLPIGFDAAGAAALLPQFLQAGELIATGVPPAETKRLMAERFAGGWFSPAPRAGVAFMLSPFLRAFPRPYHSNTRITASLPHRMFYAPNVSNQDIGGVREAFTQPFVIQEGPWGYMVQRAGPQEANAIRSEYQDMLSQLCALRNEWCLGDSGPPQ